MNILLVEDNEAEIKITQRAFGGTKYKNNIFVASDGQAVFDLISKKKPRVDIILLDLKLPKMDGFQVLERLKLDPATRSIPVVMLTTSDNYRDIERSYDSFANGYIRKPANFDEFEEMIDIFSAYWHRVNKLPRRDGDEEEHTHHR